MMNGTTAQVASENPAGTAKPLLKSVGQIGQASVTAPETMCEDPACSSSALRVSSTGFLKVGIVSRPYLQGTEHSKV